MKRFLVKSEQMKQDLRQANWLKQGLLSPQQIVGSSTAHIFVVILTATILSLALLAIPGIAYAMPNTTIVGLVNAGEQMDGQHVIVQGEVVGDIINAEAGYKWITLQDGGASMSVRITEKDAQKISHVGGYSQIGTKVEVSGAFQVDCVDHDGLSDVHIDQLTVIEEGKNVESPLSIREVHIGILLVVVGACLLIIHWRLRERTR